MNHLLTSSESIKDKKQVVDEKSEEEIESDYDNCLIDLRDNDEDAIRECKYFVSKYSCIFKRLSVMQSIKYFKAY